MSQERKIKALYLKCETDYSKDYNFQMNTKTKYCIRNPFFQLPEVYQLWW